MTTSETSKYWLDLAARTIAEHFPGGEIVISSAISPSASYHIGHFREIMTADALVWSIRRQGRQAKHIHVVDNFDPLRKRYEFLPAEFEQYVGRPVCLIPDPVDDCRDEHKTYAEHFYREFESYASQMGIKPGEIVRSYEDLYVTGRMTPQFEAVLSQMDKISQIFQEVSGRDLPPNWTPIQIMDQDGRFSNASPKSWDKTKQTIGGVSYTAGRAKLNWRLDWPARWQVLGVMVEPFSAQEHGAAGGSYDTGVRFAREVFGFEPPIPGVRYANIHLMGETTKMSSSKGNLVTPKEALEVMPPEILRYFVVRSKPDRTLYFDSGLGLYNLIDEFAKVESNVHTDRPEMFKDAYAFAVDGQSGDKLTITGVPFSHLVAVYQAALGDFEQILEILERTGYNGIVEKQRSELKREVGYVKNWLERYAPESVKFSVQEDLPKVELSTQQRRFLEELAAHLDREHDLTGQAMHDLIYAVRDQTELKPPAAFAALYLVILGKDSGPKAGWFLASLDHDWLVKRLKAAAQI